MQSTRRPSGRDMQTSTWTWKTRSGRRTGHAFLNIDLAAGFPTVEPLGCARRFRVAHLVEVEPGYEFRCPDCVAAIALQSTADVIGAGCEPHVRAAHSLVGDRDRAGNGHAHPVFVAALRRLWGRQL
jgi:hypothetical protein